MRKCVIFLSQGPHYTPSPQRCICIVKSWVGKLWADLHFRECGDETNVATFIEMHGFDLPGADGTRVHKIARSLPISLTILQVCVSNFLSDFSPVSFPQVLFVFLDTWISFVDVTPFCNPWLSSIVMPTCFTCHFPSIYVKFFESV